MASPIRRSTRGVPTLTKSTPPASNHSSSSLSSEPPRRSQRSQPATKDASPRPSADRVDDADDEPNEEEEITRCICGHQEYPGPPLSEAFANSSDANSDDAGGLFILCDGCSVWQHGGCVGIVEESQSPDKYYCEECRPKLHDLHVDTRGQRYSLYLPLHPKTQRKNSVSKHDEKAKKERDATVPRSSVDPSTGKRRATMRSKEHDDEEEQLKRAIEESRREVEGEEDGQSGKRNGKRSRDESEENKPDFKRQRTASESLPSVALTMSHEEDSDTDPNGGNTNSRVKKAKAEAAQSARQAEQREKDRERDKARAEAAGRRQERAGRRRGDDPLDPSEETTPKPTTDVPTSPPLPPSSQPPTPPPVEKVSHKKGAGRKIKKLGNNQYTKHRGDITASSPHGRRRHEKGLGSGDEATDPSPNVDTNGNVGGVVGGGSKNSPGLDNGSTSVTTINKGKFGKGRKGFPNGGVHAGIGGGGGGSSSGGHSGAGSNGDNEVERTFANMKSALDSMSAWVSRQHVLEAAAPIPTAPPTSAVAFATSASATLNVPSTSAVPPSSVQTGESALMVGGAVQPPSTTTSHPTAAADAASATRDFRSFEDLTSGEMALRIQRDIASWQEKWGHLV